MNYKCKLTKKLEAEEELDKYLDDCYNCEYFENEECKYTEK